MNPYSVTREIPLAGANKTAGSIRALDDLPNPMRANSGYRTSLLSSPEPAHGRRLAGAAVVLILLAFSVFAFKYKRQVGASLIHFGESLTGEYAHQPVNPAPQAITPPSKPTAPGPPEFAATDVPESAVPSPTGSESTTRSASAATAPKSEEDTQPAPPTAHQPDSGPITSAQDLKDQQTKAPAEARHLNAPQSEHTAPADRSSTRSSDDSVRADDGHTELALAQQYLRGSSVPQDRDIAAHLLWVAVGEGNPQAELELADLYLRTDGVPAKNCAQARILLSASSNSGNLEAGQQLAKLRDYGCR
jgi:hypothetical protein